MGYYSIELPEDDPPPRARTPGAVLVRRLLGGVALLTGLGILAAGHVADLAGLIGLVLAVGGARALWRPLPLAAR